MSAYVDHNLYIVLLHRKTPKPPPAAMLWPLMVMTVSIAWCSIIKW